MAIVPDVKVTDRIDLGGVEDLSENSKTSNRDAYNALPCGDYATTAPHLRHHSIRNIYSEMVGRAFEIAMAGAGPHPRILDLGAGEGAVTRPLLELGGQVLAVDISEQQIQQLLRHCGSLHDRLEVRCDDIDAVLAEDRSFDIIVANSLLHHIPDYVGLVRRAVTRLSVNGVFFCFQDPMWRHSISRRDAWLSGAAYTLWRIRQGDLPGGIWRRTRRLFGFYSADSLHDNTEYHAVRDGVNQNELCTALAAAGLESQLFEYCSFHSDMLQPLGERLEVRNTFGLLATRARLT